MIDSPDFRVTRYEIPFPERLRGKGDACLVFLSDLHNREFGPGGRLLCKAIAEEKPDAVLIGGDQIVSRPGESPEQGLILAERLAMQYPVYYAPGNHESRLKARPELFGGLHGYLAKRLRAAGVHYLENDCADLRLGSCRARIYGFELPREYYTRSHRGELPVGELTRLWGRPDRKKFHILLAHHPVYGRTYARWGADLTLSGHFHGGVVGLWGHVGLVSPDLRLFSRYCRGMYRYGSRTQIISAGIGEHTVPVRIRNPRELVVIRLRGQREERE